MSKADDRAAPEVQLSIDRTAVPSRVAVEAFEDGGECLLYNPKRDEASALNRTANEIWQLCDGLRSIDGIAAALATRYGVNTELMVDEVARALGALHARGLIEYKDDAAAAGA